MAPEQDDPFGRRAMAALYRNIRSDNPAIARLIKRRIDDTVKEIHDHLFYRQERSGLASLLRGR